MWPWLLTAGAFMLAALFFFLLYRKTKLTMIQYSDQANDLTVDGVAVLVGELEAVGEIIVERLEAKQREAERLIQLLDAKIETAQMALAAKSAYTMDDQGGVGQGAVVNPIENKSKQAAAAANTSKKHATVLEQRRQGLSPVEIAQRTNLKLDEVRLILDLFAIREAEQASL